MSRKKITTEQWIQRAREIHGDKYDYSKVLYKKASEKVCIICPEHGEFLQSPHDHLSGYGCPKCQLKSQTKLFDKLKEIFLKEEILFEVNKNVIPWIENQRIDIYFPKYNIAIEYNGEQHYIPIEHFGGILELQDTQTRDRLKQEKCKENNCTLFEIKYDYSKQDFDNLIININNIISNYEH